MKDFSKFIEEKIPNNINAKLNYKNDNSDNNNLGKLQGFDIENDKIAGYIYYWDKGFYDYSLVDLESGDYIIETKVVKENESKINDILQNFLSHFE